MRILNSLDTQSYSTFLPSLLPATAEPRSMDRTVFIATESHGYTSGRTCIDVSFSNGTRHCTGLRAARFAEDWTSLLRQKRGLLDARLVTLLGVKLVHREFTHSRIWLVANPIEDHAQIDEYLTSPDFSARYEIRINAPAPVVYRCLLRSDFSELWLVRLLMTVRSGKRLPRSPLPSDLRQRLQGTGFVILAEAASEELVLGIAGRFWRPDGGRCTDLVADDFVGFSRPGYAKVAWNFKLQANSPAESTVLSTETRIKCFGRAALWKFRLYWGLVGPFSGLMRKAILEQVKTAAESTLIKGS